MTDVVINIDNLSKQYHLGTISTGTLSKDIENIWARMLGKENTNSKIIASNNLHISNGEERIWALKDINLKIERGEILGVIGKNGAGKSTFLKILARITAPTTGEIKIKGHIASLLEVGTGFHPELTGLENIFLNGAILGMSKKEINNKLNDIIKFSGVEKYIDTPVKRYSSGMRVRLAFSVAAYLDSDILLVDEVLAVGDVDFQKKCLKKMRDISISGRTIIFVSHNMAAIRQLCNKAILIDKGSIKYVGDTNHAIKEYLHHGQIFKGEEKWKDLSIAPGTKKIKLLQVRLINKKKNVSTSFDLSDSIKIQIEYLVIKIIRWLDVSIYLYNQRGELIFATSDDTFDKLKEPRSRTAGQYKSICTIPSNFLNDGEYFIQIGLTGEKTVYTIQEEILSFSVIDTFKEDGARGKYKGEWPATAVRPKLDWDSRRENL